MEQTVRAGKLKTEQAVKAAEAKVRQRSMRQETFRVAALLAIVGGFLDAYTYLMRGGVFANAQTGNIVLLGICSADGDFKAAGQYLIPILAFALGVWITNVLKHRYKDNTLRSHEPFILVAETILLLIIGFLPKEIPDELVNVTVSFICSLQVNSFRVVNSLPYASTMCTGNLRSGMEKLYLYKVNKDKQYRNEAMHYGGVILFFILGGFLGTILSRTFGLRSIWLCCVILAAVLIILSTGKSQPSDE